MIVTCEKCAARYKLDDAKVSGRGAKITCPRCRHVFIVYREEDKPSTPKSPAPTTLLPEDAGPPTPAPSRALGSTVQVPPLSTRPPASGPLPTPAPVYTPSVPPAPAAAPRRDVHSLDFRKVGISSWKVRVKIGLIYDFSDYKTLRKYIQDGRVTASDLLSYDAKSWVPIGDIPDLETYFIETWEAAERRRKDEERGGPAEENPFADESPTAVVGMSDLAASSLAGNLAGAAAAPAPPTPAPARGPATLPPQASPVGGPRGTPTLPPFDPGARGLGRPQRAATTAPPPAPAPSAQERGGGLGAAGVVAVLIVVLALGGWAWLEFFQTPPPAPKPAPPAATTGAPAGPTPEDIREKMRAELQAELQAAEPDEPVVADEEPTLIPVKPKDRGASSGAEGGGAPREPVGTMSTTSSARDHAAVGDDAWRSGDYATAATAFGKAVALEPTNATWQGKLGRALYRKGDAGGAAAALSRASKGGWSEASKWLGHIARDQGDVAGAIGHYNDYLKSGPSDAAEVQREIEKLTGS